MFSSETNGYNKQEVDKKIESLLKELATLNKLLQEKNRINYSLATALEKSKEIEASAKNLYTLKIQKVLLMYKTLAKSFSNLFALYPQIDELADIRKSFDKFTYVIKSTFFSDDMPKQSINATVNTENDTIRLLLNKMSTYSQQPENEANTKKTIKIKRKDTSKPKNTILSSKMFENVDDDCPAEKFLSNPTTDNSVYAKIINHKHPSDLFPTPNESGFDLKEAVNPKENLDEIMKGFDFFNEDE